MKNIKTILIFLFMSAGGVISGVKAQDIHFSQFFETPLLRNPALAGIFSGDIRFQAVYRNQWNSVTVPYQTTSLNGEYRTGIGSGNDYITLGGQIFYDKAGTTALTTTQILPVLNYSKSLSEEKNMYLSLGGMAGIVQRRIDRSKMTTNSQYDGVGFNSALADGENFLNNSFSYFDASVGMSFNSQLGESERNNIFIGAALHHFVKPKKVNFLVTGSGEVLPKFVLSTGIRFDMTEGSYFTIQGDYAKQGANTEIIGGALYAWKLDNNDAPKYIFNAGAFIRWGDAVVPVAKLEFRPLSVSLSYDVNISSLKTASQGQGGFEFSIIYQKYRNENGSADAYRCPKF